MATARRPTPPALAHALSAAERGLAVFPLSRTKLPALRSPHRERGEGEAETERGEGGDRERQLPPGEGPGPTDSRDSPAPWPAPKSGDPADSWAPPRPGEPSGSWDPPKPGDHPSLWDPPRPGNHPGSWDPPKPGDHSGSWDPPGTGEDDAATAATNAARSRYRAHSHPHPHSHSRPCHGECGRPGHGVYDASTDPARVRALFAAAPWATGYGIACGLPPHHLIGVDLDTRPGTDGVAELRALARRHLFTIPGTVVVLTPGGGRHLWLTGPPDTAVPNSAGRLAPGIDIRGAGGYLVGPGSRTDHGVYRTAPGTGGLALAPCPAPLLRLLLPPPRALHPRAAPADGGYHGQGLVQFVLAARPGQRNSRLFWAACRAYENGIGPSLTGPLLDAAHATGLTEREARATIASAARMTGHRG